MSVFVDWRIKSNPWGSNGKQPRKFHFSSLSHPKVPFTGNFRTSPETIVAP